MTLPGGIQLGDTLRRDYCFRSLTGTVELALAEATERDGAMADRVTEALAAALDTLGGEPASPERVHGLSVGDRQYLMRRLAEHLDVDRIWLTASCMQCKAPFDFELRQSDLPVKCAGADYPLVEVETGSGRLCLRAPTGADQAELDGVADVQLAQQQLLRLLLVDSGQSNVDGQLSFSDAELERIEQAVETMAPEVSTEALVDCPECGAANRVRVDPYLCLQLIGKQIFEQVHTLAVAYHWSEGEILALPRGRRQHYLNLIDRSRGMHQHTAEFQVTV